MDQRLKTITVEPSNDLTIQRGNTIFTYTTPSTSVLTGAIRTDGGIAINNTSDATTSTAGGALTIGGGIAVFKQAYLGNNLIMDSSSSTLSVNGSSTERFFIDTTANESIRAAPDGVNTRFTLTDTTLTLTHTANATNATDAALILAGGIGISNASETLELGAGGSIVTEGGASFAKQLFAGGDTFIQGPSTGTGDIAQLVIGPAASTTDFNSASQIRSTSSSGTDSSSTLEFHTHQAASSSVGTLRLSIDNVGDVKITSQTDATDVSTGSLVLGGGIGTNSKSFMGDQLTIESTFTGNTAAHLVLTNNAADAAGTDNDTRLLIVSKSDGESTILFRNTLDTTEGNIELSYSHTGDQVGTIAFKLDESTSLVDITSDKTLIVYGTQPATSSTTGTIQSKGGLGVQSQAFFNDLAHFESTVEFQGISQVYHIVGGGDTTSGIAFTGKSAATDSSYNFFTSDGDGTDNIVLKLFAVGTPNTVTNSESLELEWDQAATLFRISSNETGTGVIRPINIEAGSANQLVVGTAGNISINSAETAFKLNVAGTVNATGVTTITDTTEATGLTDGALQVEGGVSIEKTTFAGKGITIGNGLSNNFSSGDTLLTFDIENPWEFQTTGTGAGNNLVLKATVDSSDLIIRDSADIARFTFQVSTTGTSVLTVDGTQVIDHTGTEALLIRKDGDAQDVFRVDTTNENMTLMNQTTATSSLAERGLTIRTDNDATFTANSDIGNGSRMLMLRNDNTSGNTFVQMGMRTGVGNEIMLDQKLVTTGATTGKYVFTFAGGPALSIVRDILEIDHSQLVTVHGSHLIDATAPEALLVRRASDALDVFTVNTTDNIVVVNSTEESISTTSGALQVRGGVGIQGNLTLGGTTAFESTTDALNFTTGAIVLGGGLTVQTTTNASSVTNGGGLLIGGGAAIGKDIFIGGNIDTLGPILHRGTTDEVVQFYDGTNTKRWGLGKNGSQVFILNRYNTSGVFQGQSIGIDNTTGKTTFANTTASTASNDAALIVDGGISAGATENASSLSNGGSLTVAGGAAIAKDVYIGGDTVFSSATQSTDTSTGSVILSGGLAVAKNAYIGGDTTITGNLTVQGTTTTVSTTQTLVEDNIQIFNSGPSGTGDAGFLIERYQLDNDTGAGDTVADSPTIAETFPSQSGTSSTEAILHAGASAVDDFYNGWWVKVTSGFSANQVRKIADYNGTTKRITTTSAWTTQNPAGGDTFEIFNKPFVGLIYNEVADRFHFTSTDIDPGAGGTVDYTDEIDVYLRNLTLTGTVESSSLTTAGLLSTGGATFSNTTDATSVTSGGSLTLGGGAAVGKSLIVGTALTVNGADITPNSEDIYAEKSFAGAQSASNVNITDFVFTNGSTGAFDAWVYVKVEATSNLFANFHLRGVQRDSDWDLVQPYVGDSTGVTFNITAAGQIQYSSGSYAGFTALTIKFRALTLTV